jgi:hypothetical protein
MALRAAVVLATCANACAALGVGLMDDGVGSGPAGRPPVVQIGPADYGMTVEAAVGTHVMARLSGIVTFYFDRARLSGPAVRAMYVSGGPGSYVAWFRVASAGESSIHLPFFSVDSQTKAMGGLDVTIKAAPGKPPAEPIWVELPTSAERNNVEIEVPAGNTLFIAWPLTRSADVLNGVEVAGAGVEKLMDPRWMHVLGEHEGEWLVTMVEAVSPGTAIIKFGNGKSVTLRVKKGAGPRGPVVEKTI